MLALWVAELQLDDEGVAVTVDDTDGDATADGEPIDLLALGLDVAEELCDELPDADTERNAVIVVDAVTQPEDVGRLVCEFDVLTVAVAVVEDVVVPVPDPGVGT
jgi:hypothetical protein